MPSIFDCCLNFLLPPLCVLCQKNGSLLCRRCYSLLQFYPPFSPQQLQFSHCIDGVSILAHYQPPIRNLIHALKYRRVKAAARLLAQLVYFHLELPTPDFICSVPSSKLRISNRGFNQSELIARHLSKLLQTQYLSALKKIKSTPKQASLENREQRAANVAHVFQINPGINTLSQTSVLIVDDVISTGATVSSCSQVLKKAGASKIWVAACARS